MQLSRLPRLFPSPLIIPKSTTAMATNEPPEAVALQQALSTLLSSSLSGGPLARQARALSRAADDAEVAAAECRDIKHRLALMEQVDAARGAAAQARVHARASALAATRDELLAGAEPDDPFQRDAGAAAGLAEEINDGLRRTTAVVSDEVGRSQATGLVLDESSRRLRRTRDQHGRYGETLRSGFATLSELKRSDVVANIAVVLSFALFFIVAAYVAHGKISRSNMATFLIRPAAKIAFAPVRILARITEFVLRKPVVEPRVGVLDTRGSLSDADMCFNT